MVGAAMTRTFRNLLVLALGLLLGGAASWSYAGYALMQPPQGLGFDPGVGYTWRPNTSTPPANGTWSGHGSVMYNGKRITLPGQWAPAANAGTWARNALRLNPLTWVGGVAIAIAIDAGIEYINGQWQVSETNDNGFPLSSGSWRPTSYGSLCTMQNLCNLGDAMADLESGYEQNQGAIYIVQDWYQYSSTIWRIHVRPQPGTYPYSTFEVRRESTACPAGYVENGGYCVPPATWRPATEADWANVPGRPMTDPELDELSRLAPGGMPVSNPEWSPATAPIGNPYTDPITGRPYQDHVRVTPDPTPDAPFRVRLDPYKQPLDENVPDPLENPQPDPNSPAEPLPDELPEFCTWVPVVCELAEWFMEEPEYPEQTELPELEQQAPPTVSLGLPSSGTCPAPRSIALGFGGTTELSYEPFCDLASAIRPLVLAAAFLFAAFILVGVRR